MSYLSKKDQERAMFLWYEERVRILSERTFKNNFFEQRELRGKGYELDHKLSIKDGYDLEVPPEIMADTANLRLVPFMVNRSKASRSIVTYEELLEEISERDDFRDDYLVT